MRFDSPQHSERLTISPKEAEALSGLSHTTIAEKIKTGELDSKLVGRRRLIVFESFKRLVMGDAA